MSKSKASRDQKQLFKTKMVPAEPGSGKLFDEEYVVEQGPVECLGMTFENDEKRREYYRERLHEKLKDPEFRKIEGFPLGGDEDILRLSDPPYYTACPNPFVEDFIKHHGKAYDPSLPYSREPFAADVSEGKNDPIYNAHSYHTKVPPRAILRYILHYTDPGDIVLDGFAGTGMTAVAAQLAGCKDIVDQLQTTNNAPPALTSSSRQITAGIRYAITTDLAPIGAFITRNLLSSVSAEKLKSEAMSIVDEVETKLNWLYKVRHPECEANGRLVYAVWADILLCSECGAEIDAYNAVVDLAGQCMHRDFNCPCCNAFLKRRLLDKATTTVFDPILQSSVTQPKQALKKLYYRIGNTVYNRDPVPEDFANSGRIADALAEHNVPTRSMEHTWQHLRDGNHIKNITHTHHYFTPRNLLALAVLREQILESEHPVEMLFVLTGFIDGHANKRNRFIVDKHHPKGTTCGPLSNTLFVPEVQCEVNVFDKWRQTIRKQQKAWQTRLTQNACIQVRSASTLGIPANSVDYIFVDPPFGKNIMYSELNHLYEVWLGVFGNPAEEAIVNDRQSKGMMEYGELMTRCFVEFYHVLKPGRWVTLEFHNSLNAVWTVMQEALFQAGFIVADVRVLDKKHGTLHQDSGYTVKQDLIVSAYKPNGGLEQRFELEAGTEEGVWDFVRTHLRQLPVFVSKDAQAEVIAERQNYLLFDRMVAFHVQRGVTVPMSAAEFYAGVEQRFPPRDGMYFLPDQVAEYDKKRMTVKEVLQLQLFVSDEASAIQWLKQQFTRKPQTFQEIHPQFLKEIGGWQKHEKALELSAMLEQNFIRYDGKSEVPSQVHSYLSTNFKELRNLPKDDLTLKAKAKDRWYVPDPNKAGDLEKLRERSLMREFDEYRESTQKRLKIFRLEAVRTGFKKAWQDRDYSTIITVAQKIPEKVLQEDPKLLMWYDQAVTRMGGE